MSDPDNDIKLQCLKCDGPSDQEVPVCSRCEAVTACSDGSCILRRPGDRGQHANGGCQHLKASGPQLNRLLRHLGAEIIRLRDPASMLTAAKMAVPCGQYISGHHSGRCTLPAGHSGYHDDCDPRKVTR